MVCRAELFRESTIAQAYVDAVETPRHRALVLEQQR